MPHTRTHKKSNISCLQETQNEHPLNPQSFSKGPVSISLLGHRGAHLSQIVPITHFTLGHRKQMHNLSPDNQNLSLQCFKMELCRKNHILSVAELLAPQPDPISSHMPCHRDSWFDRTKPHTERVGWESKGQEEVLVTCTYLIAVIPGAS
jgi:hypothetical protein